MERKFTVTPLFCKALTSSEPLTEVQKEKFIANLKGRHLINAEFSLIHINCYIPLVKVDEPDMTSMVAGVLAELIKKADEMKGGVL